jgi:hypothetical protein
VWIALRRVGFTEIGAAGVMGNLQSESGFDPFIVQGGGHSMDPAAAGAGGYGLAQWTPGSKLIPMLHGARPGVASEVEVIARDIQNYGSLLPRMQKAASPFAAAMLYLNEYEMPKNRNQPQRGTQAEAIFNRFSGLKFDAGGLLPPGTHVVENLTRKPEPILTAKQWDDLSAAATAGGTGGGGAHVVTGGSLDIGIDSQGRMRAWVQDMILEETDAATGFDRMGGGNW